MIIWSEIFDDKIYFGKKDLTKNMKKKTFFYHIFFGFLS